ncbi:MAG: UvrD-helicase domain-containing protein [Lachnospiraceae bacterium]|nr:UvrD-helicase domain-containing protein [Lachnospiraceae bacterium]
MEREIIITKSFMEARDRLNAQEKKLVYETTVQLRHNAESSSLSTHKIDREKCDKKFLSARVNLDLRIIFVKKDNRCFLYYVDHHDDAYDWCEGKYLDDSDFSDGFILYDEQLASEKMANIENNGSVPGYLNIHQQSLFEKNGIKQKDLERLKVQSIHAAILMKITTEDELLDYVEIFPGELQEDLLDLASGNRKYDEVYNNLFNAKTESQEEKQSIRGAYLVEDDEELRRLIEGDDFENWTIFLHPSQNRLVRMNCSGPVLIEGGPGTGKTVVGVHRAVYLAGNIFKKADGKRILICTFSKKLANNIEKKVNKLCTLKGVSNNIDVMTVDAYIAKMIGKAALTINLQGLNNIMADLYEEKYGVSLGFLQHEYYEVVERYHITSKDEYLHFSRTGTGASLNRSVRERIWPFFENVIETRERNDCYSFVDRAYQLGQLLKQGAVNKVYDAVIIDEAQDLEGIKLNVLANSVKNISNSVYILSDKNQRIFRLNSWSKDAGVSVVGRSYYLRINYRTTKQINEYARCQFMEFDLSARSEKEYISIMMGEDPEIVECISESDEDHIIIDKIRSFLETFKPSEICVLAPTHLRLNSIKAILSYEGLAVCDLTDNDTEENENAINLCTSSGIKGLEYRVIIISDFDKIGTQKSAYGDAPEVILDYDKLVECEKYVAITRARDYVLITYIGE